MCKCTGEKMIEILIIVAIVVILLYIFRESPDDYNDTPYGWDDSCYDCEDDEDW